LMLSAKITVPASQIVVAVLFLYYAIRFQRRKLVTTSEHTQRALNRIFWLAVLGFLTFLGKAVTNLIASSSPYMAEVAAVTTCYVVVDLCGCFRAFSILLVLGIRLPAPKGLVTTGHTNQSTSYGSSVGTMVSSRRDTGAQYDVAKPKPSVPSKGNPKNRTTMLLPALYGEPMKSPGNITRMSLRPHLLVPKKGQATPHRVSQFGWAMGNGVSQVDADYDQFDDEYDDLYSINSSMSPTSWKL